MNTAEQPFLSFPCRVSGYFVNEAVFAAIETRSIKILIKQKIFLFPLWRKRKNPKKYF